MSEDEKIDSLAITILRLNPSLATLAKLKRLIADFERNKRYMQLLREPLHYVTWNRQYLDNIKNGK